MIELSQVSFAYPNAKEWAVRDINLSIQEGSFVALIGHNGCGKSTIARLLNGLLKPTRGKVIVGDLDTSDNKHNYEVKKTVGVIFQNPDNQAVASIVEEDVAFGLENLAIDRATMRERVDMALNAVDMYQHRRRLLHNLSGGQKQRVAIAGVVAMQPQIIVFDESTSMLDPQGRQEVLNVALQLKKQGKTIIWISHYMTEAECADRIIVMNKGKIVLDGNQEVLGQIDTLDGVGLDSTVANILSWHIKKLGINVEVTNDLTVLIKQLSMFKNNTVEFIQLSNKTNNNTIIVNDNSNIEDNKVNQDNICDNNDNNDINHNIVVALDLSYIYSHKTSFKQVALDCVSLEITRGDFLGIIGHTGSGKSTFGNHLNGLTKLMMGKLIVDGIDLSKKYKPKELRSRVGMVFQYPEYQLFEESVYKDIGFGPKNMGLDTQEIDNRIKKAMEMVGLNFELISKKSPFELSGGQKRRVAIAGVIAMNPKLLVLDEPTAGLDPRGKKEILNLVTTLNKQGVTIVMISHNMDEIAKHCNKVAMFKQGKIVLQGDKQEVFSFKNHELLIENGLEVPNACKLDIQLKSIGLNNCMAWDIKDIADNVVNQITNIN